MRLAGNELFRQVLTHAARAALVASLRVSPWPMALLLRRIFAEHVKLAATSVEPGHDDVVVLANEQYDPDPDAFLDAYVPESVMRNGKRLPAIVWTHGGAFIGGSKDEIAGYLRIIARSGYVVVGVRYSLAPEHIYPTPIRQLMIAMRYLQDHAERLRIDPQRFILAGDSAGAQITAQLAAMATDSEYAQRVGISPTFTRDNLCGLALCCGIYDLRSLNPSLGLANFVLTAAWAYSGTRDYRNNAYFSSTVSVVEHVNGAFPPTFLTAGNADPLEAQSKALADALQAKGVRTETLFYPPDYAARLPHEYQFDLRLGDAQIALEHLTGFFRDCTND